jgi:hypothetical protein
MEDLTVKIIAHLKSGKCPKGSSEKSRGRSRRKFRILRASMSGRYGKRK